MRRVPLLAVVAVPLLVLACDRGEEEPPRLDPDLVALGRDVYGRYCAACHGPEGEGQPGWKAQNQMGELPAPPHDSAGHTWMHSDSLLYQIVSEGWRDPFNRTERLTMPAFGEVLSPRERRAVITYLKTLWIPRQRAFQWQESQDEPFPSEAVDAEP